MTFTTITNILNGPSAYNTEYMVRGRILSLRRMSKVIFMDLYDGTATMQIAAIKKNVNIYKNIRLGSIVECSGVISKTKSDETSLFLTSPPILVSRPNGVNHLEKTFFSKCSDELISSPRKKINNLARMSFYSYCREFLTANEYLEAETSLLQHVEVGGSAKLFSTYCNALGKNLFLRGTAEIQLKQLAVVLLRPVYEFAKIFRNQSAALIEFTLLETIHPWLSFEEKCDLVFNLLKYSLSKIEVEPEKPNTSLSRLIDGPYEIVDTISCFQTNYGINVLYDDLQRVKYFASKMHFQINDVGDENISRITKYREKVFFKLVDYHANKISRTPIFFKNYPSSFSPLSRRVEDHDLYCSLGYLYIDGTRICEVVEEEYDYERQVNNFNYQGTDDGGGVVGRVQVDLLNSLSKAAPPMAGMGLNINRLFSVLVGTRKIDEIVFFPIAPGCVAK